MVADSAIRKHSSDACGTPNAKAQENDQVQFATIVYCGPNNATNNA